jgi:hypothetical protein
MSTRPASLRRCAARLPAGPGVHIPSGIPQLGRRSPARPGGRSWAARFMRPRRHSRISTEQFSHSPTRQGTGALFWGGCGDWCPGSTGHLSGRSWTASQSVPLTRLRGSGRGCWRAGGRLVAASWRLPGDPVRSNRYAGEPAAGHQGLLGACCGACVTLDGWPSRIVRSQPRGLPGLKPRTAGNPAGRLTEFCPGAAPGGRAPGPAGTSGAAAGRPGCRACWRLSVANCSAAARPCL